MFFDSEDGRLYRWNLATNSLDQAVALNQGLGQPYVPSVMGPDGTVYTLNGGNFFALGNVPGVDVTIRSSSPDLRETVVGNPITFTARVSGSLSSPTGTVTFEDRTINGFTEVTTTLATNVPLRDRASRITTSSMAAGGRILGATGFCEIIDDSISRVVGDVSKVSNASMMLLVSLNLVFRAGGYVTRRVPCPSGPARQPNGHFQWQHVIGQVQLTQGSLRSLARIEMVEATQ